MFLLFWTNRILELVGNGDQVRRLKDEYDITQGVTINERTMGTAAYIFALLINRAVQTVGAEYYLQRFYYIADSVAPVTTQTGGCSTPCQWTAQNIEYAYSNTLGLEW
ncbi:MAG: hypothetical protein HPY90_13475 [Syntrophothermus sp.]|uniref:hypothetical protein n=1 Tax=Syntrophothermus sp. TaxID=2736299 RepID=UPI00257A934A|nr:hypothetical protein [Syntrophothermus sp.]NSW84257.1 hypothetical protein [Syntrophothermus sp.]